MEKYQHLLVVMDDLTTAERLLSKLALFTDENSDITFCHVMSYTDELLGMNGEGTAVNNEENVEAYDVEHYEKALEALIEQQGLANNPHINTLIEVGNPRHLLSKVIPEELNIDLILISRKQSESITNALLVGNTLTSIASKACCDVFIVE